MKRVRKFRVTKTIDEESKEEQITVEDMEEEKDKVIDMEKSETMDADEYKEVMDMCKDMGYESIKDMASAHQEMKKAKDEEKDPDAKTDENKTKDSLQIVGLSNVEVQIARIKDPKVRDQAIGDFAKFKDTMKGYVSSDKDLAKELIKAEPKVKVKDEAKPEFADYGKIVMGASNPHIN